MESKANALKRAKKLGFPKSSIVKSKKGGYFIAPRGVTKPKAKRAYAACREKSSNKGMCSAVAHNIQKGVKMRRVGI